MEPQVSRTAQKNPRARLKRIKVLKSSRQTKERGHATPDDSCIHQEKEATTTEEEEDTEDELPTSNPTGG